jgi:hypothetical protein
MSRTIATTEIVGKGFNSSITTPTNYIECIRQTRVVISI